MQILRRLLSTLQKDYGEYRTSAGLFLRLLAVIYWIAFISLWTQVSGLIGHNGILPARYYLKVAHDRLGTDAYFLLPTLGWFNSSDEFWRLLCLAGAVLSFLPMAGFFSAPVFLFLWALYLSLVTVGRDFLGFQWDALLLEAGFLAIFLASPLQFRRRTSALGPPRMILWLFWWLLFRLMFSSGIAKLLSGDPTWRDFTALQYHYETQPLPNVISWFMHQLPPGFQRMSVGALLVLELVFPFLILTSRRLRRLAGAGLLFLQILIIMTGNYAFFNLLTIALCVLLFDEKSWHKLRLRRSLPVLPGKERTPSGSEGVTRENWPNCVVLPFAIMMFLVTTVVFAEGLGWRLPWPTPLERATQELAPFCIANRYGLFAVMTTERPEIVLEGSNDGEQWQAYEFKHKPGGLARRPPWVAPHQPRLDWQMWFAALDDYRESAWFGSLCKRLLEGSPEVLALLGSNPFPNAPPKYVRGVLYDYHFTDFVTRRVTGQWWRRELKGLYSPAMSLPRRGGGKFERIEDR